MPKTEQELEVERLIKDYKLDKRYETKNGYMNWPLCRVPIEILWNTFSRSNVKLEVGDIK